MQTNFKLACALLALAVSAAAQSTETVLHNFGSPLHGARPLAGVLRDAAGDLYGTTYNGGATGSGVVFKVSPSGEQTLLHNFTGGSDGAFPYGGVVKDGEGNLYGATEEGGLNNAGVVFEVSSAGQETVLYTFTGGSDGGSPEGGLIRDAEGNLYGATASGGTSALGTVFKVSTSGFETVLHSFAGGADGSNPQAGLLRDAAGNLYGTTAYGGAFGLGTVFRVAATGGETVLYSFAGGSDGAYPVCKLIGDSNGNLYGTTESGGTANAGVVFKISSSGQESVLYAFAGGSNDGAYPYAGLVRDSAGNLYGTTVEGGPQNAGVVYKLNSAQQESVLYGFTFGSPGQYPYSDLVLDSAGNLYGTTSMGGPGNVGVVFELNSSGQETLLYTFPGAADGYLPLTGLTANPTGDLLGTTYYGGAQGDGVLFEVSKTGMESVVHPFGDGGSDGGFPSGAVILDSAGNIYGSAEWGGTGGYGTVYEVSSSGQETTLYSFSSGAPGGTNPIGTLARDAAGNLYGTTSSGGAGAGVVFKLEPSGQESALYTFTGGADGGYPTSGVIRDSAGNLYGTAGGGAFGAGVVFKVDPSGNETVLYTFTGGSDGGYPYAGLTRGPSGALYGTASSGGTAFAGVVFKLDAPGHETVLYNFTGGADGGYPQAGVVLDPAGNLYGTTGVGGQFGSGVVFEVSPAGTETVLYKFTGGADGGFPEGGVIRNAAGHLFGTAAEGGSRNGGVVFEITP